MHGKPDGAGNGKTIGTTGFGLAAFAKDLHACGLSWSRAAAENPRSSPRSHADPFRRHPTARRCTQLLLPAILRPAPHGSHPCPSQDGIRISTAAIPPTTASSHRSLINGVSTPLPADTSPLSSCNGSPPSRGAPAPACYLPHHTDSCGACGTRRPEGQSCTHTTRITTSSASLKMHEREPPVTLKPSRATWLARSDLIVWKPPASFGRVSPAPRLQRVVTSLHRLPPSSQRSRPLAVRKPSSAGSRPELAHGMDRSP